MITASNYFDEVKKINFATLPFSLQEGHNMIVEQTKNPDEYFEEPGYTNPFQTGDEVIDSIMRDYLKNLNKAVEEKPVPQPKKIVTKTQHVVTEPAKNPPIHAEVKRKESKRKKRSNPNMRTKFAAKKKSVFVKGDPYKVPTQVKAPVTVKKLSLELSTIKSFIGMDGKTFKYAGLVSKVKTLTNHFKAKNIHDHKAMIEDILSRLKKSVSISNPSSPTVIHLNPEFVKKCRAVVQGATVRIRIEFLSGVNSTKKVYSQLQSIIDKMTDYAIDLEGEEETVFAGTRFNLEEAIEAKNIADVRKEVKEMPEWFSSLTPKPRREFEKFYNELAVILKLKKYSSPKKA